MFSKFFANINAGIRRSLVYVDVYKSKQSENLLRLLRNEGFLTFSDISSIKTRVFFSYFQKRPLLKQLSLISKQGRKVYTTCWGLQMLIAKLKGFNFIVYVLTTKGLVSHETAFRLKIGGRAICVAYC